MGETDAVPAGGERRPDRRTFVARLADRAQACRHTIEEVTR